MMWVNGKIQVAAMARNQAIKDTGGLTRSNGSLLCFILEQLLERGAVSVAGITNIVEGGTPVARKTKYVSVLITREREGRGGEEE